VKVFVDGAICQGHGVCHMTAPDFFHLRDEDGQSYVDGDGTVPAGAEALAELGASSCPEQAITIVRSAVSGA
jgi:ferredoxin